MISLNPSQLIPSNRELVRWLGFLSPDDVVEEKSDNGLGRERERKRERKREGGENSGGSGERREERGGRNRQRNEIFYGGVKSVGAAGAVAIAKCQKVPRRYLWYCVWYSTV